MSKIQKQNEIIISHNTVVNRRMVTGIHFHNDYEIYYLIDGNTNYFIGDEIFYIRPGSFVFIPQGVLHKTDSETCLNNERFLININIDVLDKETAHILKKLCDERVVYISKTDVPPMIELMDKIENEYSSNELFRRTLIKHYISELFIMLFRKKNIYKPKLSEAERIMQNVAEYISANYAEEITLEALSAEFAMSKSYLSRKFKLICGIGINEYLTNVRITNAEKILKDRKISVAEAAFKCGFNDSNYFSSVFKKITGKSPHLYSKNYRE